MKVDLVLKVAVISFVSLLITGSAFGVEVSIGPAEIVLQTESARKPADFPHRQHQETYSCTACHHARDEIMVIDKCANCHTKEISNAEVNSYKKAAHKLCKDCHKEVNVQGKNAPIKCSGCHTKKQ
ncbi:MAG: cytochrome c3 family protein [Deltaproteobacteria bacterium]|jgi:predicted CXXCH cytochrome family protein|nr:cytochrome c3 family protein [Deltaproteobacteria bacterium]